MKPSEFLRGKPLAATAILIALVKLTVYAIDSTVVFYNDSGAYVLNATGPIMCPGRSKVYGLLIRAICLPVGSLAPLVVAQTLAGGLVAWLLAWALLRAGVRPILAISAAAALALEPFQLLFERMVMTESLALLAAVLYLAAAIRYLTEKHLKWLALAALSGIFAVSLKVVYVPLVLIGAVVLPVAAFLQAPQRNPRSLAAALTFSLACTALLHGSYWLLVGYWTGGETGYQAGSGYFLAARIAPILRPEDADDARTRGAILDLRRAADPQGGLRNTSYEAFQLWEADGLIERLKRAFAFDQIPAGRAARRAATHALRRDPAGFLKLVGRTVWGFLPECWDARYKLPEVAGSAEHSMLMAEELETISAYFGPVADENHGLLTPVRRYFLRSGRWCLFLFLSPLAGLMAWWLSPPGARVCAGVFAAWACLLLSASCAGDGTPSLRYLHAFAFTGLAAMALLAERRRPARGRPQTGGSALL